MSMKTFFSSIYLSVALLLFSFLPANAVNWHAYSILYIDSNTLLISNGTYSFDISLPYDCSISTLLDTNTIIYIDQASASYIGYGETIYFDSAVYGEQTCENYSSSSSLNFRSYAIVDYSSTEGFLVSDGSSDWLIDPSYSCSISSSDVGDTIYINTAYSPSYGEEIYYDGIYGDQYCEVSNSPTELNFQSYAILDYLSSDGLLITDGADYWIVDTSYSCSFSSVNENGTIYVDSTAPAYGDAVYLYSSYNSQFCTVSNFPKELHLYSASLSSADTDAATIYIGSSGYIVEYGYGCSSYDFSAADSIAFDSADGYLDTSDEIYLFDYFGYSNCSIYSITNLPTDTTADDPITDILDTTYNPDITQENEETPTTVDEMDSIDGVVESAEEKLVELLAVGSVKKKKTTFHWSTNSSDNSGQVKIQLSRKVKGEWKSVRSLTIDGTLSSHTIKKLKSGKKYRIRARFVDSSTWSSWVKFTTKK